MARKKRTKKQTETDSSTIMTSDSAINSMRTAFKSGNNGKQFAILLTREMWAHDQAWGDSEIAFKQMIKAYKKHFSGMDSLDDRSKSVLMSLFDQMETDWEKAVTENTKTVLFGATRPPKNGEVAQVEVRE